MTNSRSIKPLVFALLAWLALSAFPIWAQNTSSVPTSEGIEQAKDYPIWMQQAAALAMLLAIIFVVSVFLRGARGGWEKGKQQAETDRILKDFRRK